MPVDAKVRAEVDIQAAVSLRGADEVEFFGIPLEGESDVVFVLDRSGSMKAQAQGPIARLDDAEDTDDKPRKIEVARAELVEALERLPAETRVNVIYFGSEVQAYAESLTSLEESERDDLVGYVTSIGPSGATALAPAMRLGFLMNPSRVVLLSDGRGNRGGGPQDVLRDAREAMRGGVRIDAIGLGNNQDAELLKALARESGGLYQSF